MRPLADDLAEERERIRRRSRPMGGRPREKRDHAAAWLAEYLERGRNVSARFVFADARDAGISAKTLRRAADELGVIRTQGRSGRWRVPAKGGSK